MNRLKILVLMISAVLASVPARADNQVSGVPSNWQITDYVNANVTVFGTGSICIYGQVNISPSTPADNRNRFWALMLTAKVAGRNVVIRYETSSGNCYVTNYYIE